MICPFVFNVPLRGSLPLLLAEGILFILVSLSLGILISARTSSQRVAMLGALVGTMLPNMLLSGFIFPLGSMLALLQWVSNVVPGRWFVTIAGSIMLNGHGALLPVARDAGSGGDGAGPAGGERALVQGTVPHDFERSLTRTGRAGVQFPVNG